MGCGAVGGLVAAGIGAAGAIGGSLISSSAAKSAANTQSNAALTAAQLQEQEQQQVRADLSPYNETGQGANAELASLYGVPNPLSSGAATVPSSASELAALRGTPGYQFALTQGLESTQNSAAARGLGTSGASLKGAAQYAEGLADTTYQTNLLNPLEYLSGQGESAAAQTGVLGTQGAANAGAGIVGAGNASAAGTVGSANALSGGLSAAASSPTNYLLYSALLGGGTNGAFTNAANSFYAGNPNNGAYGGYNSNAPGSLAAGGSGYAP